MAQEKQTKLVDSKFLISLGVALAIQAAGIVWWASNLQSSVQHNDFQIQMLAKDVDKHSIFVRDWPAGKWGSGSLPDDVKQNLKISMLELDVEKIMEKLYNGTHSPTTKK
jgi:hypothetical protein|tara:strand:+ start:19 stop:348 length:330 start_codon:yes stop_codon:yes gene_type:complete